MQILHRRNPVAQVRADQIGNFLLPRLHRLQEQSGIAQLILVRRIGQNLHGFVVRRNLFIRGAGESEVPESIFVLNQQLVEERELRVQAVAKHHVAEFVRQNRCQARFIGQHVNQPAAEHDGMPQRKRFQRGRGHHPATNVRLDVQVVGDFEIVHHGFKNFVHFAFGCD